MPNSAAPNEDDDSDELDDRPDQKVWVWVSVIIVLLISLGIGAPFAYRASKAWRARGLINQAKERFQTLDVTNAVGKLRLAIILAPDDNYVLRMVAETFSLLNNPEAITYWNRLEQKGAFTDKDRLNRARIALATGQLAIAGTDLRTLYAQTPKDTNVLGLSVDFFRRIGNQQKTLEAAGELLAVNPESTLSQLITGSLLSGDPSSSSNRLRGQQLLFHLATTSGENQTNSWRALETVSELTKDELNQIVFSITNRPTLSADHLLIAAKFSFQANTNSLSLWIPKIQASMDLNPTSTAYLKTATWLLAFGEGRWLANQLSEKDTGSNAPLFKLRLQALSDTGDLETVRSLISKPEAPLTRFDRTLFQGDLAFRAGKITEAKKHWTQSLLFATNSADLQRLATAASSVQLWDTAFPAWEKLLNRPFDRFETAVSFIRAAEGTRDQRIISTAYRRFLTIVPDDIGIKLELIYLHLILGEQIVSTVTEIEKFPEPMKSTPRVQLLRALGQLRSGTVAESLASLERMALPWETMPPRWRALYSASLGANNQREASRRIASLIPTGALLTSEREYFGTWVPLLR